MPLFKANDFWIPNNTYYATDRYKSVIMYGNQLYVCNTTHRSGNTFDSDNFDVVSGSGGGSSSLIENEWDISSTTVVTPPIQTVVRLNDVIDSTFYESDGEYTIVGNNPLTEYPLADGYLFGGYKYNIDFFDTEFKEIVISDINPIGNDYITFILSSLDKETIFSNDFVPSNSSFTLTYLSIGGSASLVFSLLDGNGLTVVENQYNVPVLNINQLKLRMNVNSFEILLNDVLVLSEDFNGEVVENWQSYLGNSVNMYLVSINLPSIINRTQISYNMPTPFTITESVIVINPPENAVDGSLYKLTSEGNYRGFQLYINDRVIFQNSLQDLILLPDNVKNIPSIELDIFKNKVYERGIIDEIFLDLPNIVNFPLYYTFWVVNDSKLYSICDINKKIEIDVLDNTFRIKNSGLILERNDSGIINPSQTIEILDENYYLINDMKNNLGFLQISEENKYEQRLLNVNVDSTNNMLSLNLPEHIGHVRYIFDNSVQNATLLILNEPHIRIVSPSYNNIKETIILIRNPTPQDKLMEIYGYITNINHRSIKIKKGGTVCIKVISHYNNNDNEIYAIGEVVKGDGMDTTLFVGDEVSYITHHTDRIIINTTQPTATIQAESVSGIEFKYDIYNNGNSTITVYLILLSITYQFTLMAKSKKELMALTGGQPNIFVTGVY